MKHARLWASILIAAILSLTLIPDGAVMAQQEGIGLNVSPADSALSEEESAQAKKKEQSELLRAMEKEALLKLDIPEDRAEELIAFIENVDREEAGKNLEAVYLVLTSEDFQTLFVHPEVQELIQALIARGAEFVYTDRELTVEILETLEVQPEYIYLFMRILEATDDVQDNVLAIARSDIGIKLISLVQNRFDHEALEDFMGSLLSVMENAQEMRMQQDGSQTEQ